MKVHLPIQQGYALVFAAESRFNRCGKRGGSSQLGALNECIGLYQAKQYLVALLIKRKKVLLDFAFRCGALRVEKLVVIDWPYANCQVARQVPEWLCAPLSERLLAPTPVRR